MRDQASIGSILVLSVNRHAKGSYGVLFMRYRPEIDGLCALAVLPVIFFYAGLDAFRGGFVGADIFLLLVDFLFFGT